MVKPATKCEKGTTAPTGKTNPRTLGVAINKKSPIMHSQSLSTDTNVPKAIKTRSSSVKNMAAACKVGSNSGARDALVTGQISHSRKVSKAKVVGHKSLASMPRFPPPISGKMRGARLIQQ